MNDNICFTLFNGASTRAKVDASNWAEKSCLSMRVNTIYLYSISLHQKIWPRPLFTSVMLLFCTLYLLLCLGLTSFLKLLLFCTCRTFSMSIYFDTSCPSPIWLVLLTNVVEWLQQQYKVVRKHCYSYVQIFVNLWPVTFSLLFILFSDGVLCDVVHMSRNHILSTAYPYS